MILNNYITVIIPLYNKEYQIEKCLTSVINQELKPFEIIVIDDGSTDKSFNLAKSILDNSSIKFRIIKQLNSGVSSARNNGVKISKTPYIAFLDADDCWESHFLEKMTKLIEDYPNAAFYSCGHKVSNINNSYIIKSGLKDNFRGYIHDFYLASSRGSIANSSKVIVKKEIFEKIGGFPKNVKIGEDLYLWIMLSLNNLVAYENFIGVTVYQYIDNSRQKRKNLIPYPLIYFSENIHYIKENKSLKRYLWRIYIRHFLGSIYENNIQEAKSRFNIGKILFPLKARFFYIFIYFPLFIRLIKKIWIIK